MEGISTVKKEKAFSVSIDACPTQPLISSEFRDTLNIG